MSLTALGGLTYLKKTYVYLHRCWTVAGIYHIGWSRWPHQVSCIVGPGIRAVLCLYTQLHTARGRRNTIYVKWLHGRGSSVAFCVDFKYCIFLCRQADDTCRETSQVGSRLIYVVLALLLLPVASDEIGGYLLKWVFDHSLVYLVEVRYLHDVAHSPWLSRLELDWPDCVLMWMHYNCTQTVIDMA